MQLPENEENIVEDQPTEAVDSDADDNENQEDFSEEVEDLSLIHISEPTRP